MMQTILSIVGDYWKLYHYPHKNGVKMTVNLKKIGWKFQRKIFSSFGVI